MRFAVICLLLAWTAGFVSAQNASTEAPGINSVSLQEALKLALEHNLDVQIESYNPRIAEYELNGLYGGYEPSLNLAGEHDYTKRGSRLLTGSLEVQSSEGDVNSFSGGLSGLTPWGMTYSLQGDANDSYGLSSGNAFESSSGSASVRVTQPLLKNFLIDGTRLSIKVARNRLKYSELTYKLRIMSTVAQTEQAYYDLISTREMVTVQQKAVELASRLVQENRKRVEVGALAPLDEQQAEAQAASSEADLITAKNNLAIQEHALKNLITDQYSSLAGTELVPADSLSALRESFSRQDSWSKGLTLRPDFLQAKLDVERAGIQLKYARNQLLPQLDIFGSYGYNGSGNEFSGALDDIAKTDRPFYTYGGQITIPLGNTSARNRYKSGKVTEEQTLLVLKRLEQQIMVKIDDAIRQAESSFQRVAATRKAREYAEAALDAEQKKLDSGKSTTYTVLQIQRDLTTARGNEIQALASYNKALSQLSYEEGVILDRRGINLEIK